MHANRGLIEKHKVLLEMKVNPDQKKKPWKKFTGDMLRKIYNQKRSLHSKALSNFRQSGTNTPLPDFWDFCGGDCDVLYLSLQLQRRGDMAKFCAVQLEDPLDSAAASDDDAASSQRASTAGRAAPRASSARSGKRYK